MKTLLKTIAVLVFAQFVLIGLNDVNCQDKKSKEPKTETMKCWASMSCEKCVAKIEKNIPFEKGVTDLKVDLPTKMVSITYKPEKTNPHKLERALQKLGYQTEIVTEKK